MADTERHNAIQHVRTLQNDVTSALDNEMLTHNQRELLDEVSDHLRETESFLVMSELKDHIARLEEKSDKMNELNQRSKKLLVELNNLANAIDKVSGVISKLAKAMAILSKAEL